MSADVTTDLARIIALASLAKGAVAEADEEHDEDKADRLRSHAYETLGVLVDQAERLLDRVERCPAKGGE